jgi:hypothetical protein
LRLYVDLSTDGDCGLEDRGFGSSFLDAGVDGTGVAGIAGTGVGLSPLRSVRDVGIKPCERISSFVKAFLGAEE